ncbi:hypothetical protein KQ304_04455 [Synechococcus sp. CS-1329]|uniref:hypothetical protein n=1 Tax=Synechococcus sp. CS-1329 TaxID=2847975 RepID=UPI00223BE79E|nr:hypothetical protein [Synechococcus sp. CS-1329]MCT0218257.1 hypothetical protein [Synechococcus sp. CS-1329]
MLWLKRWNFIERARLERELWDAFEAGENIEAMVEQLRSAPVAADGGFRLEVWETTRVRIRRIETLMRDQPRGGPPD